MNPLESISKKKKKLIVGLMSGTSADGIDAVLVQVEGSGVRTKFRQLAFETLTYPRGFREMLLRNSSADTARLDEVVRLNFVVGEFFAEAVRHVVRKAAKNMSDVDLIGSHGQTICHLPKKKKVFRENISATLQIGEPSVIAKRTGILTVGDFRPADIAVGGSGAPLVPYVDYLLFRSPSKTRILLNIGGIANVTLLPKGGGLANVLAFDTGAGNMVIDGLMRRLFGKAFDRNGETASRGNLLPKMLSWMMRHPYLRRKPPKSVGREKFGEDFINELLRRFRRARTEDVIATASEFTALSIYEAYLRFIHTKHRANELLVSGGGVHNVYLMDALRRYFGGVRVDAVDKAGMSSDAKEAICFALLANETIAGNAANVPGATGAQRSTVLGKICFP